VLLPIWAVPFEHVSDCAQQFAAAALLDTNQLLLIQRSAWSNATAP